MEGFKRYKAEDASSNDPIEEVYVGVIRREDLPKVIAAPQNMFRPADVGLVTDIELVADYSGEKRETEALIIVVKYGNGKPSTIGLVNTVTVKVAAFEPTNPNDRLHR